MKILILGGINEALVLAQQLIDATPHNIIYSLAGKGKVADINCDVRVGGFNGAEGLAQYLISNNIDLLIDATHPYADNISFNAWTAADQADVELWAYHRPAWEQHEGDHWVQTPHWFEALTTSNFKRPFITLGSSMADFLTEIPKEQHWVVRTLPDKLTPQKGMTLIEERGPFHLADEENLLADHRIDVLVCKNSGGNAVAAKILAARQKQLPIIMLSRPQLPEPKRLFLNIDAIYEALC